MNALTADGLVASLKALEKRGQRCAANVRSFAAKVKDLLFSPGNGGEMEIYSMKGWDLSTKTGENP